MKLFALLAALALTVSAIASTFDVTCPACRTAQTLEARNVRAVGGYVTNIAGVHGSMVSSNADFRCSKCRLRFPATLKPVFIPETIATPSATPKTAK